MAEITATLVKELRDKTGAGMMDCKRALSETAGDVEGAVDWLRKKGLAAAAKKAGRVAAEGLVGVSVRGTAAPLSRSMPRPISSPATTPSRPLSAPSPIWRATAATISSVEGDGLSRHRPQRRRRAHPHDRHDRREHGGAARPAR